MNEPFKLTIELVPASASGKNLRLSIKKSGWLKIRQEVIAKQDHKCGVCGGGGKLICHEIWSYDDENHIQRLAGFIAICGLCNFVKHIGFASHLAGKGRIDMQSVEEHFLRINECDLKTFREYVVQSGIERNERSKYEWTLDFGDFQHLFEQYKQGEPRVFEDNDPGPNPGRHMPDTCPHCGSKGTVVFCEEEYDEDESEAWMAEYEAGLTGSAVCAKCNRGFQWQGVPY